MTPITGSVAMKATTRYSGPAPEAETEAAKSKRSRRWVRKHRAAIKRIGSGWGVDEHGRPCLIAMRPDGKMKKKKPSRKTACDRKASHPKPALVGADHALPGEA